MKSRVLFVVALLLFSLRLCEAAAPNGTHPNIVFILVDDLRYDALGCMGHPFSKTPNIDRLATEGVLFKNFFVDIPLCSPSRGSFLTGTRARSHGVIDNTDHSALSHQLVTFPRLLQDSGYETAFVGKWHMGTDDSPRPGFNHWTSFKGQGVYQNPNLNIDGKVSRVDGYITDILNARAVEFIKQDHTKPFLLYLGHKAVHGPFTPAERHKDLYTNDKVSYPPNVEDKLDGKLAMKREMPDPKARRKQAANKEGDGPKRPDQLIKQQLRALASIDEGVGMILKALEDAKQLDNTLVIFTSDNGFFWGEHQLSDKRWAYEDSIRIPMVMRYPKLIKAGSVRDQMGLNIDIAPTLLELGGASIPKNIEGQSLIPIFKDGKAKGRQTALFEYFEEKMYARCPWWQAVRTEQWKFIHYPELEGMDELYDLKADPYEMKNLISEKSSASQLKKLKEELQTLPKQVSKKS